MKAIVYNLYLFVCFTVFISEMSCSVDPLSPRTLRGRWTMLNFTDKQENLTFVADKPTDIGNGVTRTISGVLLVSEPNTALRDSEINIIIGIRTTIPGQGQHEELKRFFGEYVIDDSTLTIDRTKVFKISRNDLHLTLEDDESLTTWGKID